MCSADYNLYTDVPQPLDIFFSWSFYVSERKGILKYSHKNTTSIAGPWGKKKCRVSGIQTFFWKYKKSEIGGS